MVCTRRNEAWNTSDRREGDGFSGSMRFECTPVINVRKYYPLLYYSAMIRLERDLSLAYSLKKEKETQEHCFIRKVPFFSRERRNQRNQNASERIKNIIEYTIKILCIYFPLLSPLTLFQGRAIKPLAALYPMLNRC